jgi:hypothetical protein
VEKPVLAGINAVDTAITAVINNTDGTILAASSTYLPWTTDTTADW